MALIVLAGGGGSPGVTTTALALALAWPREVVVAECDPAGGSVLAGLWQGRVAAGGAGLLRFAVAAQRDPQAAAAGILGDATPLEDPPGPRFVLTAAPGPAAARQLTAAWPAVSAALGAAKPDIIADIGRFDGSQALVPLLAAAATLLMVCRPGIRQAAGARPRLAALARIRPVDGLVLVGTGAYGSGAAGAVSSALKTPVADQLPDDGAAAAVLADGAPARRGFRRSPLIRAAASLAGDLATKAGNLSEMAPPAGARR
jgi:hypothetical protein